MAGPWQKVLQGGYLSSNLNGPHVLVSACRQKERGPEFVLYYIFLFVLHMQNLRCTEQMLCQ